MTSPAVPYSWEPVTKNTDCYRCHYTIQAADPEGMFFFSGQWFCSNDCGQRWSQDEKVNYSHQFLIAVTVGSVEADPDKVSTRDLLEALRLRTADILEHDRREAFGHNDTEKL